MAKVQKIDRGVEQRMDEFEQRLFVLKIDYEKHFSGLDAVEPLKERDDLKRLLRDLQTEPMTATRQQHRLRTLRARFATMELYWQRNLLMIERGTHPKMRFRADLKDRDRGAAPAPERPRRMTAAEKEELAFRTVFDKYIEARRQCGQSEDLSFESVHEVLKKQVRTIKSRYSCEAVKFRVSIEEGKAKVKAVPLR